MGLVLDMLILFGLLGGLLLGLRRGLARMLVSFVMLFLATLFSALLYNPLIGVFTSSLGNPESARTGGVVVFFGLLVVFYALLEYAVQRNYPNLNLRRLGAVNNILGAIVGVLWAMLGISLLLLIIDFGGQLMGGPGQFFSNVIRQSNLTPLFREVFKFPLALIRLLFPQGLPEILRYFAR